MKTPEKIKKGLEACGVIDGDCENCPYDDGLQLLCVDRLRKDALAYIQQLEAGIDHAEKVARECARSITENLDKLQSRLAKAERERDAAVNDLEAVDEKHEVLKEMIDDVVFNHEPYALYLDFRNAADAMIEHDHADIWRGPCPENTKEARP